MGYEGSLDGIADGSDDEVPIGGVQGALETEEHEETAAVAEGDVPQVEAEMTNTGLDAEDRGVTQSTHARGDHLRGHARVHLVSAASPLSFRCDGSPPLRRVVENPGIADRRAA
ncbi:hypothetical protein GCM10022420_048220 [Streptomyces iranensis]